MDVDVPNLHLDDAKIFITLLVAAKVGAIACWRVRQHVLGRSELHFLTCLERIELNGCDRALLEFWTIPLELVGSILETATAD